MPRKLFTSVLCPSMKVTEEQLESDINILAMEKQINALNRRRFLGGLAAAGATAATIGSFGFATQANAQTAPSIVDVLNFALNLEYLEANLYIAVSGQSSLSATDTGGGPTPMNAPSKLTLDTQTQMTAVGLAMDELHHIELLRGAITSAGGTPIEQPQIDYSAGGTMSITTQAQFLAVARQFTAVGNSAYAGAAQFLVGSIPTLTTAAQILGAEAQHLGAVGYLCALQGVMSPQADTLDYPPTGPSDIFTITPATDTTGPAIGPSRSTSQVLGIVYGVTKASTTTPATGVTKGGFFPNGVNGAITST